MIKATDLSKKYGNIQALTGVSTQLNDGEIFGLVGSNGAGKSTFLRLAAGILKPDSGTVELDGVSIYENIECKSKIFYISDEQFFYPNANAEDMLNFYAKMYPAYDKPRFASLMKSFELDKSRKINTYSKGMKKQLSVICGVCAGTDYLFCDETFDGLDPVARQAVKSIFASEVEQRGMTPIIASHNLRELEDICDHVGLLHKGGIVFSRELDEMKLGISRVQCVFDADMTVESFEPLEVLQLDRRGSMYTLIVRADSETAHNTISAMRPIFLEVLPLTLEEIFITETEARGYDIKKFLD